MKVRELIIQLLNQDLDDEIKIAVQSETHKENNDIDGIIESDLGVVSIIGEFELDYKE